MKYTYTKVKTKESIEWYKTKSGKKLYRVRFKRKINGKNIPYTKNGFKTIAEAVADRDHAISQINKTNGLNNEKMTVGEYWKAYYKNKIESHEWTADTANSIEYQMRINILPHYKSIPLNSLNRMEYQSFINEMLYKRVDPRNPKRIRPLARRSVLTLNRAFQALVNSAVMDEIIDHNRIQKIKIKKKEEPRKRSLTVEEAEKVLLYFREHTTKLRFAMLYLPTLGLRRGEVTGIKYGAVKPYGDGYLLSINSTRTTGSPKGKGTKNQYSERTLYVEGEPAVQLSIALREFKRILQQHDRIPNKDDFIFIDEKTAKPVGVGAITTAYNYYGKKMGIWPLHPHMFRHTVATNSAVHGVDNQLTAQFLGHKNTSMTDYYKEPTLEGKKVVMAALNDSFKDVNKKLG